MSSPFKVVSLLLIVLFSGIITERLLFDGSDDEKPFAPVEDYTPNDKTGYFSSFAGMSFGFTAAADETSFNGADSDKLQRNRRKALLETGRNRENRRKTLVEEGGNRRRVLAEKVSKSYSFNLFDLLRSKTVKTVVPDSVVPDSGSEQILERAKEIERQNEQKAGQQVEQKIGEIGGKEEEIVSLKNVLRGSADAAQDANKSNKPAPQEKMAQKIGNTEKSADKVNKKMIPKKTGTMVQKIRDLEKAADAQDNREERRERQKAQKGSVKRNVQTENGNMKEEKEKQAGVEVGKQAGEKTGIDAVKELGKESEKGTGKGAGRDAAKGAEKGEGRASIQSRVPMTAMANLFVSPANGTDVLSHPIAVIKCSNQTLCIQPRLQLILTYNVYFCKHNGNGVRFFYLAKEGLLLHPNIIMNDDINSADIIVYLPVSAPWHKSECNKPEYKGRTIVLDEGDGPQLFEPDGTEEYRKTNWLAYFKRSYVHRTDGQFKGYMGYLGNSNVFPMTYTIIESYVKTQFNMMKERDLDIVCTLRGSKHDPTRLRVRQWVEEYVKARGVKKYVAGQVNDASRTIVSTGYLTQMFRAKIIVTSNPSDWEGDFRLMEAMASGALIFVDRMFVPRPSPLVGGTHIVYYDNMNKTDIFDKLDLYRKNLEVARRMAVNGYLHSMKFHRAANLMDYVFRTVHLKLARQQKEKDATVVLPHYRYTGYDMRQEALDYRTKMNNKKGQ